MRSMRVLEKYHAPHVRACAWQTMVSLIALFIASCGNGGATEQPDESPAGGGSDGTNGSAGDFSGAGGTNATGGEQATDAGVSSAAGHGGAADGGSAGGSVGQGGTVGVGGGDGAASPCGTIVYDGEGAKTNLASGATFVWPDGGSLTEVTGTAHGGIHSMKVVFTPQGGWAWNWGHWVDKTRGVDASQATQLSFWLRATAPHTASGIVTVDDNSSTQSNRIDLAKHLAGGLTTTWQKVSIPMSEFTGINKQHIWEIYVEIGSGPTVEVYFDDAVFETPCP